MAKLFCEGESGKYTSKKTERGRYECVVVVEKGEGGGGRRERECDRERVGIFYKDRNGEERGHCCRRCIYIYLHF